MDIQRIPIDRYVCDSCNDAITDTDYRVVQACAVLYDHGLYCPRCSNRLEMYAGQDGGYTPEPVRLYYRGQVIEDLSREIRIGSSEDYFDPEEHC